MHDAWTPREPYVEPPRQQRKAVDLADVKTPEADKPAEGKPEAKAEEQPKVVSVADIDARLAAIEKSVAKLAKLPKTLDALVTTVEKLTEKVEAASSDDALSAAWKKFAGDAFDAAHQASRARQPLQNERYEIKPMDETAFGRIQDSDYGFDDRDAYNDDANRRLS
jgi:hypothetical protein